MDLRERLDRLTSISKTDEKPDEKRTGILNDLRQRIERVLEPKTTYKAREISPIEGLLKGDVLSTPYGEAYVVDEYYPPHLSCGEMRLDDIFNIPTYPAHLLARNDRLKELNLQRTLFLDTETTGLSGGTGTVAFMVGLGFFEGGGFRVRQLFMRDYSEEKACLWVLRGLLESFDFLVTFNGRYYDVPLLETRFILSRMTSRIREIPDFDLLPPSRKIWKGVYENCRLVTLESRVLGMERGDDIPSALIPDLYFNYVQTRDGRKIQGIFHHNRMDILAMVALVGRIHLIYHDPLAARPRKGVEHFALGRLFWDHGSVEKAIPCFEMALKRCDDDLGWEVMRWLSRAFKKTGNVDKARALWEEMAAWPDRKDSYPFVELAKYHEHRLKDIGRALDFVGMALSQTPGRQPREMELLLRRRERLERKRTANEA